MKNLSKLIILVTLGLFLAGCGAAPFDIKFQTAKHLNSDEENHSLPVEVIVYQLRDAQVFKQATFQELWQNDRQILAGSLLARHEVDIAPGSKIKITLHRNKNAEFIGVVAIFRKPQGGRWRDLKKFGRNLPLIHSTFHIFLIGNRIQIK